MSSGDLPAGRAPAFVPSIDVAPPAGDYRAVIASDACTSPKRDVNEQLMREVFPRLARVRTTAQVLEMLRLA